ncbi:MAG: Dyp-type peroxidase [bacterium]|nr:Dyp-type peroxidase [bacterium]
MAQPQLNDIQGLIMSGYAHLGHGAYIFLTIPDATSGKTWLRAVTPMISTSQEWPKDANGNTIKPSTSLTIGLSHYGLTALGLNKAALDSFPYEFREGITERQRARILGDVAESAPKHWEIGGRDPENLHVILVLLADSAERREAFRQQQQTLWEQHGLTLYGSVDGDKLSDSREHFGFLDGVSQPKIEGGVRNPKAAEPTIKTGEFILGYENEYGQLPDSPQLDGRDLGKNGSYMVFRKLYQDVAAFWNYMKANVPSDEDSQAQIRALSDDDRQVWLAAKMVGRWPRGTPLVFAPFKDDPSIPFEKFNTFYFRERDPHGQFMPLGSHVRRSNPRDSLPPNKQEALKMADRHLIIRRGLPYGTPLIPLDQLPPRDVQDDGADRGLVFLCINANIKRQFEFIQQTWANNRKFHGLYNDKDPILGDNDKTGSMTIPRDPVRLRLNNVPRFVQVRGGGYFFLPSITALKLLSAP